MTTRSLISSLMASDMEPEELRKQFKSKSRNMDSADILSAATAVHLGIIAGAMNRFGAFSLAVLEQIACVCAGLVAVGDEIAAAGLNVSGKLDDIGVKLDDIEDAIRDIECDD